MWLGSHDNSARKGSSVPYLLNLFYAALALAVSPWLIAQSIRTGKYRAGWAEKLLGSVPVRSGRGPCVWLHAVSVGEVNVLQPLLEALRGRLPAATFYISATTKTGYELARKKYGADCVVCYCPLDFSWAVRRAMHRVRPDLFVLAELELWPNLIWAAQRSGARVAVVNGRLSENSARGYRRIRPLVERMLRPIDMIAVQTDAYAARFLELGADPNRVVVTGSLKFDGAESNRVNTRTRELSELVALKDREIVFLAGSTQDPEERLALQAFLKLLPKFPRLRLVLVPRHPERFDEVAALLDRCGVPWTRRSQLTDQLTAGPLVLLVDAVGELGAWWGTAHIAFVGGSMGKRGGQNMIEPAAYGAAVSFGPQTRNFRDVVAQLLADDAAVVVENGEQMHAFVQRCLVDGQFMESIGERAQRVVERSRGATDMTAKLLIDQLPDARRGEPQRLDFKKSADQTRRQSAGAVRKRAG
jgi:3-deoxy-D-manno-octulosonic-acid transferase